MIENAVVIIFVIGYALIAFEERVRINKAAVALLTAVACWAVLAVGGGNAPAVAGALEHHLQDIAGIVFFLIGAMTVVELMDAHGGFRFVADAIRVSDRRALLWSVSFVTFFLSSILGLLPTAIVMVSLLDRLVKDREDRLIFSSMIILAANAGGAWSPIGDVTTTMLWIGGRVSALGLMGKLIIPSLVSMVVPLIFLTFSLKSGDQEAVHGGGRPVEPGARRVFWLGLGALIFVPVFKGLTGLPPFVGMLLGLGVLWFVTDLIHTHGAEQHKVPRALSKIELPSIVFFLGILLAIAALEAGGILHSLAAWMDQYFVNKDVIVTLIGLSSAVIDNVPLTAATMGMYDLVNYPMDHRIWEMLAYAVGTGGSILIIGSAAGVVVMGMEKITFGWYLRRISLPALLGYLAGIGAYIALTGIM